MPNLCFSTRQIKGLFIITHYYCSANVMNDVRLHGPAVLCTVLHAVAAVVKFHSFLCSCQKRFLTMRQMMMMRVSSL